MDTREEAFKTEMVAVEKALKIAEDQLDYKTLEEMKNYRSFLRRCYHGAKFSNHIYKPDDDFNIDIAILMQKEFIKQFSQIGIGKIDIRLIWDYSEINQTIQSIFKQRKK